MVFESSIQAKILVQTPLQVSIITVSSALHIHYNI